jgi:hypothetical protein
VESAACGQGQLLRAIPEITERGGRAAIKIFLDGWSYFLYWLFVYGWVSKKLFFMGGWSFFFNLIGVGGCVCIKVQTDNLCSYFVLFFETSANFLVSCNQTLSYLCKSPPAEFRIFHPTTLGVFTWSTLNLPEPVGT